MNAFAYLQLSFAAMHLLFIAYFIKELFTEDGRRNWEIAGLWILFNLGTFAFDASMGLGTIRHG